MSSVSGLNLLSQGMEVPVTSNSSNDINQTSSNNNELNNRSNDVSDNSKNYTEAREELFREISNLNLWIGRIEATAKGIEKIMYSTASESELEALNDSYYKLNDTIRQLEYDIKDIKNGGY